MNYALKSDLQWVRDTRSESPAEGYDRYVLAEDPSIDILFSFSNDDLLQELHRNGLETLISQITRGKNIAQLLVSDEPVKLFNVNSKKESGRHSISYETRYSLGPNVYSTYEVLYLYPGNNLHATLRWRQNSNQDLVKKARISFGGIQIKQQNEDRHE